MTGLEVLRRDLTKKLDGVEESPARSREVAK